MQGEPDDFLTRADFLAGLGCLAAHHLTYDLLLFPKHLALAADVVARFPQQQFILDHCAKPFIRDVRLPPPPRSVNGSGGLGAGGWVGLCVLMGASRLSVGVLVASPFFWRCVCPVSLVLTIAFPGAGHARAMGHRLASPGCLSQRRVQTEWSGD